MYYVTVPHVKKGRTITPQTLLPLPWDTKEAAQELSEADIEAIENQVKESLSFWEKVDGGVREQRKATYESIIKA